MYRTASNKRPLFLILFYKRPFSNSFKSCGNTNGSEDGLIHCFKEGELCQNGRKQLISQLHVLDELDLITVSDVDEADNAVFRIEDDEIIDVDI